MLRRVRNRRILPSYANVWPIYQEAGKAPSRWPGWPEQKKFALLLTHDVESSKGQEKCGQLAEIEKKLGNADNKLYYKGVTDKYPPDDDTHDQIDTLKQAFPHVVENIESAWRAVRTTRSTLQQIRDGITYTRI